MTKDELARKVVQCAGFRWLPGMITSEGVVYEVRNGRVYAASGADLPCAHIPIDEDASLDLDAPGTWGGLMALLGEHVTTIGGAEVRLLPNGSAYIVWYGGFAKGQSYGEALARALLVASGEDS